MQRNTNNKVHETL